MVLPQPGPNAKTGAGAGTGGGTADALPIPVNIICCWHWALVSTMLNDAHNASCAEEACEYINIPGCVVSIDYY